jgi:hypothetical protein
MRAKSLVSSLVVLVSAALPLAYRVGPAAASCGGFRPVSGPEPPAPPAILTDATASGPSNAWAVGNSGGGTKTLIERWDGSTWSVVPAPSPGDVNKLKSVSASSATDAWAVGVTASLQGEQALLLHWDGARWARTPLIEAAQPLLSVEALAPNDVWVGGELVFLAHFDGTSWVPVPHPDLEEGDIHDIDATGPNDIWFAGIHEAEGGAGEIALVERWDGERISVVPTPIEVGESSGLKGIEVISPTDGWVVGDRGEEGATATLIEHWDGSEWTVVPSPNPGTDFNELSAVAAVSPDDIYAAGTYSTAGIEHALVVHWDGASWTQLRAGGSGSMMTALEGVAAAGPARVFAVGSVGPTPDALRPLVERTVRCS